MKKFLSALFLVSFLGLILAPAMALAVEPVPAKVTECKMRHDLTGTDWETAGFKCPTKGTACPFDSTTYTCGSCCVLDTVYTVVDWIFVIVVGIAAIMLFLGAFEIVTAGGVVEKVTKGRTYIIYALIGLFVAIVAKAIPALIKSILGV